MRSRRLYLAAAVLLGMLLGALPAMATETSPTVTAENIGSLYEEHRWMPPQVAVSAGGGVMFSNPTEVKHGVHWINPPATPACDSGVPVGTTETASGTKWSGTCKFTQPGKYTYYCTVHGSAMSGTVTVKSVGEPIAITEEATVVGEHGATLNGTVNPEGKATTYHFNYGTSASYGQETPEEPGGAGSIDKAVSAPVSGLPGTTYHYQLVAKNGSGTTRGSDRTFTTLSPPGPPSATTGAATAVNETKATLNGTVNPDGRSTKYLFEWGTSTGYGNATTETPAGEDHSGHLASAPLAELAPGTVYHFRLVAKNTSAETAFGVDQAFTTASPPPSSPPPSSPPPAGTTLTTPTPPPITPLVEPLPGPPIVGSPSLAASQHGSSVRGSLDVSRSGAGGRLEVDLLAKGASLAKTRHSGSVRVGRLVRASVSAGKASFSVALTAAGKRALARKHRLPLTVKIALTPTRGTAVSITRSVTLRS